MTKHKKIQGSERAGLGRGWGWEGGGIRKEKRPLESNSGKFSQSAPEAADTTICTTQRHLKIQRGLLECSILVPMGDECRGKKDRERDRGGGSQVAQFEKEGEREKQLVEREKKKYQHEKFSLCFP